MKAIVQHKYGSPDDLELRDVDKPVVGDDGVLVRVRAASINSADWRVIRGEPYVGRTMMGGVRRPKPSVVGLDVAGEIEAVGRDVTQLKVGDEVFGASPGALAEYVTGKARSFVPKPARLSFEEAAAVPVAARTALQALRDKGRIQPGQQVLISGASGGVGTFAVQIAKAFGAEVTGVCSGRSIELVRSIGADHVVDYAEGDFTRGGRRYDLVIDIAGNRSALALRRLLVRDGTLVVVGAPKGRWMSPVTHLLGALVLSRFVSQRLVPFISKASRDDLIVLKELIEAGKVTPVIDRTYPLSETVAAFRHLEAGHPKGKVVITL